jgi:hypothetical protein
MKKRTLFIWPLVSAFVCLLFFAGCPSDPPVEDEPMDTALKGTWTNKYTNEKDARTFTIEEDGHFEARLNPFRDEKYLGWGTVRGKLVQRSGNYTMTGMSATPQDPNNEDAKAWTSNVTFVQGRPVKIELKIDTDGKALFTFSAVGSGLVPDQIKQFFGGDYYKVEP